VITKQVNGGTPLSVALFAALSWLKSKPELTADPDLLLEFVSAWVITAKPATVTEARQCGIHAVKEVAGCRKDSPLNEPEVLNPEDLRE
jgi:hypothetical protein